jgi:Cu(I)/Ag(I) efflux system membrane fusion protein
VKHELNVSGYLSINERETAMIQLRTQGFVESVWPLAAGDFVEKNQELAEFTLPEWTSAQYEFLAIKDTKDLHLLHSARVRLILLGMPDTLIQRLEKTNKAQDRFIIRAPISGVISEFNIRTGMVLDSGYTLARINNLDSLWLDAAIPEDQIAHYKVGDIAEFFNPEGTTLIARGNIDTILPTVSSATRTITVRTVINNQAAQLKPGRTGLVKLSSSHSISTRSLAIPTEAIIRTGLFTRVIVAENNGAFIPKNIQLGAEVGEKTLVLNGLEEGQKIVASAQFILDSEASMLGFVTQKNTVSPEREPPLQLDTHQQHADHPLENHQMQEQHKEQPHD